MQVCVLYMCILTGVGVGVCLGEKQGVTFGKMLNHKHGPHYSPSPHPSLLLLPPPNLRRWFLFLLPCNNGEHNTNGIARNSSSWVTVNCICTKWASCFSTCHPEQQGRLGQNNILCSAVYVITMWQTQAPFAPADCSIPYKATKWGQKAKR